MSNAQAKMPNEIPMTQVQNMVTYIGYWDLGLELTFGI